MAALYRKYRPTSFDDMIGQQHITTTLVNQMMSGTIGHAYLFVGSRGTGKTTAAKIFARAINCTGSKKPCQKCTNCQALQSNNVDIVEIDAASNNGVENIRELIQNINFTPVNGQYKVYIVDEVHMLSTGAFNALLKTLEEPPKHIVFVLATTEAHRLPSTIISRCMRFDFSLVDRTTLIAHLQKICKAENKAADKEALDYIAMRAEGSVRDALSILDTVFSYCDNLTLPSVQNILGSTDKVYLIDFLKSISTLNVAQIFETIHTIIISGRSVPALAKDIVSLARDLLIAKSLSNPQSVLMATKDSVSRLQKLSTEFTNEFLLSVITIFSSIDSELRYSVSPRAVLEVAAFACAKQNSLDIFGLQQRLDRLEESIKNQPVAQPVQSTIQPTVYPAQQSQPPMQPIPPQSPPPQKMEVPHNLDNNPIGSLESNATQPIKKINSFAPVILSQTSQQPPKHNSTMDDTRLQPIGNSAQMVEIFAPTQNHNVANPTNTPLSNNLNSTPPTQELDSAMLWGKMIRNIRLDTDITQTNRRLISSQDLDSIKIMDNKLILECDDKRLQELDNQEIKDILTNALKNQNPQLELIFKKVQIVDMDTEIERIKKLIGDVPIKITRTRNTP